jgi:hypothetical protein
MRIATSTPQISKTLRIKQRLESPPRSPESLSQWGMQGTRQARMMTQSLGRAIIVMRRDQLLLKAIQMPLIMAIIIIIEILVIKNTVVTVKLAPNRAKGGVEGATLWWRAAVIVTIKVTVIIREVSPTTAMTKVITMPHAAIKIMPVISTVNPKSMITIAVGTALVAIAQARQRRKAWKAVLISRLTPLLQLCPLSSIYRALC